MNIGDLIRLKRKSHRLTQHELGKILLSSSNKISRLEKNPMTLLSFDLNELHRLSNTLDIDINLLIEEKRKLNNK